jgi:chromosome segregation ATPase
MSTAGKVLVVLILLASLAWIVLAAGVDQLSRNGNAALAKAAADLAKAEEDLAQSRFDMVHFKDQTTVLQESGDQRLAVLLSRQADAERASSSIKDTLNSLQYQFETVQETTKSAEQDLQERLAEKEQETKAVADARAEVEGLIAKDAELTARLKKLREDFQKTFANNVEMVASSRR